MSKLTELAEFFATDSASLNEPDAWAEWLRNLDKTFNELVNIATDARRYLTEFGSIEPETLARRIDSVRIDVAILNASEGQGMKVEP